MVYKQCSWRNCTKIIPGDKKYCMYHMDKWQEQNRERYNEYDKRRKADQHKAERSNFYSSTLWNKIREIIIHDCYGMDIVEYYRTGKIIKGQTVHHIIPIEDDWDCRTDLSNLIYLSESNHKKIHELYGTNNKAKKETQKMLFNLLDRFNDDYI